MSRIRTLSWRAIVIIFVIVGQIIGGLLAGILLVLLVNMSVAMFGPGDWHCSTKLTKSIDLLDIHFDVQARECVAGGRHIETTTAISAARGGDRPARKIFEYFVPHGGGSELALEEVDAHTVRIVMPVEKETDRDGDGARYMGLRVWEGVTFVFAREPAAARSRTR